MKNLNLSKLPFEYVEKIEISEDIHHYFYIDLDGELMNMYLIGPRMYDKISGFFREENEWLKMNWKMNEPTVVTSNLLTHRTGYYIFKNDNNSYSEWKFYPYLIDCLNDEYDTTECPYIEMIDYLFDTDNPEDMDKLCEITKKISQLEKMG